jgi:hypothetical protein
VNVNLIVIFKCVSLKYLNINISARAASVALSGAPESGVRVCVCVSHFCPIPMYKIYAKPRLSDAPLSKKAVLLSSGADISSKGMCVSG